MIWPFFGSLALAGGTIVERLVLMKRKVSVKLYQFGQFLSLVMVMIPFLPFFWSISPDFYSTKNILILFLVILLSVAANLFTFFSMKWEKLGKLESAKITEPLFTILLAFVFSFIFGEGLYDRNSQILIPALISAGALIFAHMKRHHLTFNKYFIAALIGSFLFASELIVSRLILNYFNPITFYFIRCAGVLIFSFIFFRPKFNNGIDTRTTLEILGTGVIWFVYRIIVYFGYTSFGVIETTLAIMLGPVLVYFFAWKFLKEKLNWKQLVSAGIIIGCVLYVIVF
ncbi:DMT family transporter [archaeon]|nr:DMT family transporter [archaeon]